MKVHSATAPCARSRHVLFPVKTSNPDKVTCQYCRGEVRRADVKPCGTSAAYKRHYRHGEKPCEACRQANIRDTADRKAARARKRKALAA